MRGAVGKKTIAFAGFLTALATVLSVSKTAAHAASSFFGTFFYNLYQYAFPVAVFDFQHSVRLFDVGWFQGPMVPYGFKFFLVCALVNYGILKMPYFFSYLDKKVLGRKLPKKDKKDRLMAGFQTMITFSLRIASYLLASLRETLLKRIVSVDRLVAWRMGLVGKKSLPQGENVFHFLLQEEGMELESALLVHEVVKKTLEKHPALKKTIQSTKESDMPKKIDVFLKRNVLFMNQVYQWVRAWMRERKDTLSFENISNTEFQSLHDQLLKSLLQKDWTASFIKTPMQSLTEEEQVVLGKIQKQKLLKRWIAKIVGTGVLANELSSAEMPAKLAAVIGRDIRSDLLTIFPFTGTASSAHYQFSNPKMLAVGDQGSILAVVNVKAWIGWFRSLIGEVVAIPASDYLRYVEEKKSTVPDAYKAVELNPLTSHIDAHLKKTKELSFLKTALRYGRGFQDFLFWRSFYVLGRGITVSQWKTWKIWGLISGMSCFLGYFFSNLSKIHSVGSFAAGAGGALLSSFYMLFIMKFYAYLTFGVLWDFHMFGMMEAQSSLDEEKNLIGKTLYELAFDLETKTKDTAKIEKTLSFLESKYAFENHLLPQKITQERDLFKKAQKMLEYVLEHPPEPIVPNQRFLFWTPIMMGILTTVIAVPGFSYAWEWGEKMPTWAFALSFGGFLLIGYSMQKVALRRMRHHFEKKIKFLETLIQKDLSVLSEDQMRAWKQELYQAFKKLESFYKAANQSIPEGVEQILKNLSFKADGKVFQERFSNILISLLENPPVEAMPETWIGKMLRKAKHGIKKMLFRNCESTMEN